MFLFYGWSPWSVIIQKILIFWGVLLCTILGLSSMEICCIFQLWFIGLSIYCLTLQFLYILDDKEDIRLVYWVAGIVNNWFDLWEIQCGVDEFMNYEAQTLFGLSMFWYRILIWHRQLWIMITLNYVIFLNCYRCW
jgi:hypothetical protein